MSSPFTARSTAPPPEPEPLPNDNTRRRWPRLLLWPLLIALVLIGQTALWWFAWQHEHAKAQDATDAAAQDAAADIRQRMTADIQAVQQLVWSTANRARWQTDSETLLRDRPEIVRLELRDSDWQLRRLIESAYHPAQFDTVPREHMLLDAQGACARAHRSSVPTFSRSYFMPAGSGSGKEVVDLCLSHKFGNDAMGVLVATLSLSDLLSSALPADLTRSFEITWIESDGTRLARIGMRRGAGAYSSVRLVDVAGFTLPLRLNSVASAPTLITQPQAALVLALSLALTAVLALLVRDVRRRAAAERELGDALAFRNAMEDSLITGLRARDMQGRLTYVNQAFCRMVGFSRNDLIGTNVPPYWPVELRDTYGHRQASQLAMDAPTREGVETLFMRRDGERFPVMIFEAPLIDPKGKQTGWMGTVLDMGAQRKAEELSRQQQERLQAASRLATMGEMASLLSHELNQPLAAIASYANGSLNLLPVEGEDTPVDRATLGLLRQATARIAEQAERAGRVIRSVHQFVRRRERLRENVRASELVEAVLPLVRLAARRSHTHIEVDIPSPPPRVSCDRTMVEQVLLNLARNGLQAMESLPGDTPVDRVLTLRVREAEAGWVAFNIIDRGPGIPADVAPQIFTPFFTTKSEGLGIGLAMCRTVVEQHGGALDFVSPLPPELTDQEAVVSGTAFRFTLPAAGSPPQPAPASVDTATNTLSP